MGPWALLFALRTQTKAPTIPTYSSKPLQYDPQAQNASATQNPQAEEGSWPLNPNPKPLNREPQVDP